MNKIKNIGLVFLSVFLLTACGSSNDGDGSKDLAELGDRYELDENTPAWKLDTKEDRTELTWFIQADEFDDSWGDDLVTKQIQEDLNLDIEFLHGDEQALNTHFAGNDIPDIISFSDSGKSKMSQDAVKWALPLNELADKYDPYFYEVAAEETLKWYEFEDGNTYGYASFSNTEEDLTSGDIPLHTAFIVRDDVAAALPDLDFTTPSAFEASLDQINEKFPELTPFGFSEMKEHEGALGGELQDIIGVKWLDENDEFYDRDTDNEYLMWLEVLREMHDKNYISDDSFADDWHTAFEKIEAGKYATMYVENSHTYHPAFQAFMEKNPDAAYSPVDAFESEVYSEPAMSQVGLSGHTTTYITKENRDPAKSIQLFTYMISEEGAVLTHFGVEGETFYIDEDGFYHLTDEMKELRSENKDEYRKNIRLDEFPFFSHDVTAADQYSLDDTEGIESVLRFQEWGKGKIVPKFEIESIDPDEGTIEARNLSAIEDEWTTTLVKLIRSDSKEKFDSVLSDFKSFRENQGWEEIVEVYNKKIKENINKLSD